jgi:hypothetical protein
MSTRSLIGYKDDETCTIRASYCHWDGYPSHHGPFLTENYNNLNRARALVEGGPMSNLGSRLCDIQRYNDGQEIEVFDSEALLLDRLNSGISFIYLYDGNKWCWSGNSDQPFQELGEDAMLESPINP